MLAPSEIGAFRTNLDSFASDAFFAKYHRSQLFLEFRFACLERFVAGAVLLHSTAEATLSGLWGLPRWDMSRGQAHLRVNTTACPVPDVGQPTLSDAIRLTTASVVASNALDQRNFFTPTASFEIE